VLSLIHTHVHHPSAGMMLNSKAGHLNLIHYCPNNLSSLLSL
jgi:hypothetical protein